MYLALFDKRAYGCSRLSRVGVQERDGTHRAIVGRPIAVVASAPSSAQ